MANTIPKLLQSIMWELINNLPVDSIDYLQVFYLSSDINGQRIIHSQENPDYKKEYVFNFDTKIVKLICDFLQSGHNNLFYTWGSISSVLLNKLHLEHIKEVYSGNIRTEIHYYYTEALINDFSEVYFEEKLLLN